MDINKETIKKELLLHLLGVLDALANTAISIDDATRLLLKPYVPIWLEKNGFDSLIVKFFWEVIELEDAYDLGEEVFFDALRNVKNNAIKELKRCGNEQVTKSLCHYSLKNLE